MNFVGLSGRLGQDPELNYTKSGTAALRFTLATNDYFSKTTVTNWHTVKAFGQKAELIAQHSRKGDFLCVEGRLFEDKWEDRNGNKRRDVVVMLNDFTFGPGNQKSPQGRAQDADDSAPPESDADVPF